jgi:hypothetical protein
MQPPIDNRLQGPRHWGVSLEEQGYQEPRFRRRFGGAAVGPDLDNLRVYVPARDAWSGLVRSGPVHIL